MHTVGWGEGPWPLLTPIKTIGLGVVFEKDVKFPPNLLIVVLKCLKPSYLANQNQRECLKARSDMRNSLWKTQ